MDKYLHHISGFFTSHAHADRTFLKLIKHGVPAGQMHIFSAQKPAYISAEEKKSDAVLKDILVDGTIGTIVGTGTGALLELALIATNVSLFIASPLVAPLMLMGWGASIGGLIGAAKGTIRDSASPHQIEEGWLSKMIGDAIKDDQTVLIVHTITDQETLIAKMTMHDAVGRIENGNSSTL